MSSVFPLAPRVLSKLAGPPPRVRSSSASFGGVFTGVSAASKVWPLTVKLTRELKVATRSRYRSRDRNRHATTEFAADDVSLTVVDRRGSRAKIARARKSRARTRTRPAADRDCNELACASRTRARNRGAHAQPRGLKFARSKQRDTMFHSPVHDASCRYLCVYFSFVNLARLEQIITIVQTNDSLVSLPRESTNEHTGQLFGKLDSLIRIV